MVPPPPSPPLTFFWFASSSSSSHLFLPVHLVHNQPRDVRPAGGIAHFSRLNAPPPNYRLMRSLTHRGIKCEGGKKGANGSTGGDYSFRANANAKKRENVSGPQHRSDPYSNDKKEAIDAREEEVNLKK